MLVRPIAPVDRALVADVLERLGDDSRYRRFLAHRSAFTDLELDYLTNVDHRDHEALIAIDVTTGVAVGVARYVRVAPRTAEPAVTSSTTGRDAASARACCGCSLGVRGGRAFIASSP